MLRTKYIFILFALFSIFHSVEAIDIQYGTVLSTKGSSMLVSYYGIDKKQIFLCSTSTLKCSTSKKTSLSVTPTHTLSQSLKQELKDKDASHITFSPSGNLMAYYTGGTDTKPTRIFAVKDLKNEKEYSISSSISYWDLVYDENKIFDFSPDNNRLVYLDDKDGFLALYITDTTKFSNTEIESRKLPTSAYQISQFLFSDNETIYYIGNTKNNLYNWALYKYDLKTDKDTILESNVSYVDPIYRVGSSIVFNRLQQKGYGPEAYNLNSKKIEQFKFPNIVTKKKIINQEVVDTGDASGIMMGPSKYDASKTYPLVIWLHGGPYRQTSYGYHPYHSYGTYDSILELLQKNNVIVLKLDYRGSLGFGRAYAEGIKGSVGDGDVEDVMNAITYAEHRYKIGNTYLIGNSYGGYLSLKTLVEHPETLKGVISINGVTDWESLLVKMKTSIFNTEFNGLPNTDNRNLYDQASIANKIGNIGDQKIKIIAGVSDRTIPIWQATDLYDKLKNQNKNVSIVKYAGEDHVYKKKKTIADLCKQVFNFIEVKVDKACNI